MILCQLVAVKLTRKYDWSHSYGKELLTKMKIVAIVGARPQFIKAAVVSRAIREFNAARGSAIEEILLHTGQHYNENMSQVFFDELDIPTPEYNLGITSFSHGAMTGRMLEKIEEVLLRIMPDWVLVYGDTNSTLAGALAAKKLKFNLAHVEAGLRSFNMRMPEEQNRLVTDRLSDLLFCPTETAVTNLGNEGIPISAYGQKVISVGDVMYDAVLFYSRLTESKSHILDRLGIKSGTYILSTIHRAENTDVPARLENIILALKHIASQTDVILPLHPRTRKILLDTRISTGNIKIINPVPYLDTLLLEKNCKVIITDSGGMQKEAYFFQKPCLTVRDETEWVELVNAGVNHVVGTDKKRIIETLNECHNQELDFSQQFYGNGKAGRMIVDTLLNE